MDHCNPLSDKLETTSIFVPYSLVKILICFKPKVLKGYCFSNFTNYLHTNPIINLGTI